MASNESTIMANTDGQFPLYSSSLTTTELTIAVQTCDEKTPTGQILPAPSFEGGKMSFLETNLASITISEHTIKANNGSGDGNDSGVEAGVLTSSVALQRALSSNSAGYASSSGGLDAPIGNTSCNSSILSFCSDSYETKAIANTYKQNHINNDCTSEGGSESSSLSGGLTNGKRSNASKKRVELADPANLKRGENSVARSRSRAASASRAVAHIKALGAPNLATLERARSRDKAPTVNSNKPATVTRSTSLRRQIKPESLPTGLRDQMSPAVGRGTLTRTPSITRGRTPIGTPLTDNGRWPPVSGRASLGTPRGFATLRGRSTTPEKENIVIRTKYGPMVLDSPAANPAEKFATLPRRRKERSVEDLEQQGSVRSTSVVRDRMTSSTNNKRSLSKESSPQKTFPPYTSKGRKMVAKTKIYHETCVQTAMTCIDIENAFAGKAKDIRVDAVQLTSREVQVDIRDKKIEQLEERLRRMTAENENLQSNLSERTHLLQSMEQQLMRERDEKMAMKKELKSNTERVLGMLESAAPQSVDESNCDSLLMLESQIQLSGHVLEEKQGEINTLRSICKDLQNEMKRSLSVQQSLIEQKEFIEKETSELQDFLQDEKTAIVEALKEAEINIEQYQEQLGLKEAEVERLRDECRHLVRISEQRRQEFLGMQSKYTALESRSKEMVVQQSSAVSCATHALTGLASRLNSLVEQLVTSYNISEQELEDLVYHNEVYTISGEEESPESEWPIELESPLGSTARSPVRHQSFIKAVLSAIKSAAITAKGSVNKKQVNTSSIVSPREMDESDITEMLDSETEPCLMMENVLEDVSMPDAHSHNMVSSTNGVQLTSHSDDQTEMDASDYKSMNKEEESLYNLCQAIANRQEIEHQTNLIMMHKHMNGNEGSISISEEPNMHESMYDVTSISECSAQTLVDQIIDVDNLVTKLLKILRIIQIEDDHCIQRLIGEKNKLQLNQEEIHEKLKDCETFNVKLKNELEIASKQLIVNSTELANSRMELQHHRNEIDRLNEDICNLSTLCSQNNVPPVIKEHILGALKVWQENKEVPKSELVSHILAACSEIPVLQEMLHKKGREMKVLSNNHQADPVSCENHEDILETKRQYAAINRAIETLNSIQSIVQQCPALKDLQQDPVPSSQPDIDIFHETSSTSCDCNANGPNNSSVHTNNSDKSPNTTIDLTV